MLPVSCNIIKLNLGREYLDKCICGHLRKRHVLPLLPFTPYCRGCFFREKANIKHEFKLDNLSYIEELAKERGLI